MKLTSVDSVFTNGRFLCQRYLTLIGNKQSLYNIA